MTSSSHLPGYAEYQSKDFASALPKLQQLAEAGDAEAQCMVGTIYQHGLGGVPDPEKAAHWYRQSFQQGYGVATNNLAGILLMQGKTAEAKHLY